jgi:predicted secreted Zn-dependent protease
VASAQVTLDLKYHIPNWVNLGSPSAAVIDWWQDLIDHVWRHERRHGAIAREGADVLLEELKRAPVSANCRALDADLVSRGQRVINDRIQPLQRAFDRTDAYPVRLDAR